MQVRPLMPAGVFVPQAACSRLKALLPQLDAEELKLRNRAYASPPCALADGRLLIWQHSGELASNAELHATLAGQPMRIAADNLAAIEARLQGFESFVPSEACTTLVEHALSPVLDLIERLAGQPLSCHEYRRGENHDEPGDATRPPLLHVGFVLPDRQGASQVRGRIGAPAALWRSLEWARAPQRPNRRYLTVPLDLIIQLGRCHLPLAELRALEAGDALRVNPKPLRGAAAKGLAVQLLHASARLGFRARAAGLDLILETAMSSIIDPTPRPAPPSHPGTSHGTPPGIPSGTPAGAAPAIADEDALAASVQCELGFELGAMQMSLAEMARLRPGQALRLGARLQDQPVRIVSGGRLIARGELAALGDELVVVVTETGGLPLA